MTIDPAAGWQSWHVHLAAFGTDVMDRAVAQAVAPVVSRHAVAPATGGRRPWFFVRYWQGGPHLRLRIHGPDEEEARQIEQQLARAVAAVDAAIPAGRRLTPHQYTAAVGALARTGEGTGALDPGTLRPPGVVRARYEPETDRYGGAGLLGLSEQLFHLSSGVALRACLAPRGRQQVFGQTLAATAVTASALPRAEIRPFLESVRDGWESWARSYVRDGGPTRPPGGDADDGAGGGGPEADRLRAQAEQLRSAVPELLRLMGEPGAPWDTWADPLRAALPVWSTAPGGRRRAHGILGSHLHMTANRLGAGAGQEGRTAALLLLLTGSELP
ncbi:lantibiotic dehydratase C-terminal domain-containing protein [Kitasatospora sp. NPDC049258]|uniref:lantibiotic dehydratase C-terminal domain-containing protein n=1 Tax=Kitasatospora sp. NPDC049258 TaxID=3155394 RepID=UPI00341D58B7